MNPIGVTKGSQTLHSIIHLTLADIAVLCRRLGDKDGIPPRIVGDCSNLVYKFSGHSSAVASLANHFRKFATAGVIIVPVCDGRFCPIAKQATNIRIAAQKKSRIAALQLRSRIRELKEALSDNQTANDNLEKELRGEERNFDIPANEV